MAKHPLAPRGQTRAELIVAKPLDSQRIMDDFLNAQRPATREAYGRDMACFARFCEYPTVNDALAYLFKQDDVGALKLIFEYKTFLRENISERTGLTLTPNTINRRLCALRSVCKFAKRMKLIAWDAEIDGVKKKLRKDTAGPSIPQIDSMLDLTLKQRPWRAARDSALLILLFKNSLRSNEVLTLDLEHLDTDDKTLAVLRKGYTERERVPLTSETIESLQQWLQHRGDSPGALFLGSERGAKALPGRTLRQIIKRLGLSAAVKAERARPHGMRHTSLSDASQRMTLPELQKFSGHKHLSSLEAYLHADDGAARRVAESLDGRLKPRPKLPDPEEKKPRQ